GGLAPRRRRGEARSSRAVRTNGLRTDRGSIPPTLWGVELGDDFRSLLVQVFEIRNRAWRGRRDQSADLWKATRPVAEEASRGKRLCRRSDHQRRLGPVPDV